MACRRHVRLWLGIAVLALCSISFPRSLSAAENLEELRNQAIKFEKERDWSNACSFYAFILTKDRTLLDIKERFQTCLRHLHRLRRHEDTSYRQQVLNLEITVALKLYGDVISQLHAEYLEADKADLTRLFRQGVEELRLALTDETFRRDYLPDLKREAMSAFLGELSDQWSRKKVSSQLEAQTLALRLALAAKQALGLKPTVAVLELACGACNALDEHTYYLTPRQFNEDYTAIRGASVGVGLELTIDNRQLTIAQVAMNSPAAKASLMMGDRILSIDKIPARRLSLTMAMEKLRGRVGSAVELEVQSSFGPRRLFLTRQPLNMSVTDVRMRDAQAGVGYIQLTTFHENTLHELDLAIRHLELQGMKSLVLDLRGNPGGLLEASVQVSERFLEEGAYIVSARGRVRLMKKTSHNPSPMAVPLVVLVDGGTASAAEVLAGALKDNDRATIVGQTTYGKGTVQQMVELKSVQAGGIRITWAKYYTPLNQSYDGKGIAPHIAVERSTVTFDEQMETAVQEARQLARQVPLTTSR